MAMARSCVGKDAGSESPEIPVGLSLVLLRVGLGKGPGAGCFVGESFVGESYVGESFAENACCCWAMILVLTREDS